MKNATQRFKILVIPLLLLSIHGLAVAESDLEVTYLANEGYLLRAGDQAVIIDGFVTEPYSIYGAVPPDAWAKMIAGEPPFEKIDVALVSHIHRDHVQPDAARTFLERHPETVFASSPHVVDAVGGQAESRRMYWPAPGTVGNLEHNGVRVQLFRLPHGGQRHKAIQNLGHVIEIGGFKILHIGDADGSEKNYEPYELSAQGIDVALVPYWFLLETAGRELVANHLQGRFTVASHVPPEQLDEVAEQLARTMPEAVLFRSSMESRRFHAAPISETPD